MESNRIRLLLEDAQEDGGVGGRVEMAWSEMENESSMVISGREWGYFFFFFFLQKQKLRRGCSGSGRNSQESTS